MGDSVTTGDRRGFVKLGRLFLLFLLCVVSYGCRARIVEVPVERIKTEYIDRSRVDSVVFRDTVSIVRLNDTVYIDKVRWRERVRELRDTLSRVDTVTVVQVVEVPAPRAGFSLWRILTGLVGVLLLVWGVYTLLRRRLF